MSGLGRSALQHAHRRVLQLRESLDGVQRAGQSLTYLRLRRDYRFCDLRKIMRPPAPDAATLVAVRTAARP